MEESHHQGETWTKGIVVGGLNCHYARIFFMPRRERKMFSQRFADSFSRTWFVLVALFFVFLCGCDTGPPFAVVKGRVTVGGKPLDNVRVTFSPLPKGEAEHWQSSSAVTGADGTFVLLYDGNPAREGAVVGEHKVIVYDPQLEEDIARGRAPVFRLHEQYRHMGKTPLTRTVEENKINEFDLRLQPYSFR